jgi:DNA-binding NarL/FixJ family response regulator
MPDGCDPLSPEPGSAKTILFVEGEGLRPSVALSLGASGYHLIVARGGAEALQKALQFQEPIHILLANVEMPDMTGIELAQRLNRERPGTRVFLVSNLDSGMLFLDHGWQFLPAPFESHMVGTRIRDILKEPARAPKKQRPTEDAPNGRERLTKREIQVLQLIAAGNSTKQVAAILGIAFKTAVGHRSRLMKKLAIHDSATLVRHAIRAGLIDP